MLCNILRYELRGGSFTVLLDDIICRKFCSVFGISKQEHENLFSIFVKMFKML